MRLVILSLAVLSPVTAALAADADTVLVGAPLRYDQAAYEAYQNQAISGYVEGAFAHSKFESGEFEADGNTWALRGTFNAELQRGMNLQLDAGYSRASVEGADLDTLIGAAHAYYRQPDRFAVGAFAQGARYSSNVLDLLAAYGADDHATDYLVGGEAALFTDIATFYGQVGFGQAAYSGFDADHLMAKAGVRIYATDNLRFDGEAALNRLSAYGGDIEVQSYGAAANYRLDAFPVTGFVGYRYDTATADAGDVELGSLDAHHIMTGLRFHFGSGSLKEEERRGPVWNTSTPLL